MGIREHAAPGFSCDSLSAIALVSRFFFFFFFFHKGFFPGVWARSGSGFLVFSCWVFLAPFLLCGGDGVTHVQKIQDLRCQKTRRAEGKLEKTRARR
jgi:hypothetical protein